MPLFFNASFFITRPFLQRTPPITLCLSVDVTDSDQLEQVIQQGISQFGSVACLINNAGVMLLGQADSHDLKKRATMLNDNVMGVLNGIHAILNDMKQRKTARLLMSALLLGAKLSLTIRLIVHQDCRACAN